MSYCYSTGNIYSKFDQIKGEEGEKAINTRCDCISFSTIDQVYSYDIHAELLSSLSQNRNKKVHSEVDLDVCPSYIQHFKADLKVGLTCQRLEAKIFPTLQRDSIVLPQGLRKSGCYPFESLAN